MGKTALDWAILNNREDVARLLGSDVSIAYWKKSETLIPGLGPYQGWVTWCRDDDDGSIYPCPGSDVRSAEQLDFAVALTLSDQGMPGTMGGVRGFGSLGISGTALGDTIEAFRLATDIAVWEYGTIGPMK